MVKIPIFLICTFVILVSAANLRIGDVLFDENALTPEVPSLVPQFSSNNSIEFQYLVEKVNALGASMNGTFDTIIQKNTSVTEDFIRDRFVNDIDQIYYDIFLSLSISKDERLLLLSLCHELSKNLAIFWSTVDPGRFDIKSDDSKPNFQTLRLELEREKDLAVSNIFDSKRHLGSSDSLGKSMRKRLFEVEKELSDDKYFGDPDYRLAQTLHKFLEDAARLFSDYNNLFRFPEGVTQSIEEQFQRKLQQIKTVVTEATLEDFKKKYVSEATSDAHLIFCLLPLFRDPIGKRSGEIDLLLADIRKDLIRLQLPHKELELCFIKRMRIRFEKAWYSIDWVLQYANFIFVQSGGKRKKTKFPDYAGAGYLVNFADWAESVFSWNIDSIEGRLLNFTIRAIQNELESAEIFQGIKLCGLEKASE